MNNTENVAPNVYAKVCPSREILAMIGEKWTALVILALEDRKVLRFGELKRICEGVSQKMLTQTLRRLEQDGLISRTVFAEKLPLKVEYRLTKLGKTLVPIIQQSIEWSQHNMHTVLANRAKYTSEKE